MSDEPVRVDDIDEMDPYDAQDPLHIRLERLELIVAAAQARDDPKFRTAAFALLNRVLDELDDGIKKIYALRERIS